MRILFLTNFYPPFSRGGYEQWCQEVAVELARRGHQVQVLTSQVPGETCYDSDAGVNVARRLSLEVEKGLLETIQRLVNERKDLEAANLREVQQLIDEFQPDVALIWGMWNVPRSVPALVEELLPGRVAYYLCDYWLSLPNAYIQRWQVSSKRQVAQFPKYLLGKLFLRQLEKETSINLKLAYPICVSRAVRDILVQTGVPIEHAQVIYGGTQVEEFIAASQKNNKNNIGADLRLVYIGRLVADKGVHTILQALNQISVNKNSSITLDIYGKGDPDYISQLKAQVQEYGLEQVVTFRGSVPRTEIPAVLAQYDGLIFSSEWEEPFARTVLEAMAAGLVVIGTTTGGTGEILIEGKTGLTYPAGNINALAKQIEQLVINPSLQQQLASAGQQCVIKEFTFSRMVNELEATLQHIKAEATTKYQTSSTQGVFL